MGSSVFRVELAWVFIEGRLGKDAFERLKKEQSEREQGKVQRNGGLQLLQVLDMMEKQVLTREEFDQVLRGMDGMVQDGVQTKCGAFSGI